MKAWRKGREFVGMLERKQMILHQDIVKIENNLVLVKLELENYQQEFSNINHQLKKLNPEGVMRRADIYKGIRQQGVLLTHQQYVIHKINQLESEAQNLEQKNEQLRASMTWLNKRCYKLSDYLQLQRRDYISRCDNAAENEIQEMAEYGWKNF